MARKKSLKQAMDELIDLFTPEIRNAFLASMQDVVDNAIFQAVIDAVAEGDVEKAFRAIGFSDAAMRPITAAIERAFETGGVMVGSTFPSRLNTPNGQAVFRFDPRNSRAEAWLRDKSSTLVARLTDEVRVNIRNVMTENMQAGNNPRKTALDLVGRIDPTTGKRVGGIIGLTNNQERWVSNTRRDLMTLDERYFSRELRDKRFDRLVRKAIDNGKSLSNTDVEKLVTSYKNNALRYRGETVARTEAIASLNQSEFEAHKQAVDMGAINASATKRIWDSAGDARVRHSHRAMDGQAVAIDEPFKTPSGALLMYPGDTSLGAPGEETIQCRCRVRLKVSWLDDLD